MYPVIKPVLMLYNIKMFNNESVLDYECRVKTRGIEWGNECLAFWILSDFAIAKRKGTWR
jgi:hypothetical protein